MAVLLHGPERQTDYGQDEQTGFWAKLSPCHEGFIAKNLVLQQSGRLVTTGCKPKYGSLEEIPTDVHTHG